MADVSEMGMVERVARALWDAEARRLGITEKLDSKPAFKIPVENMARAAIAAMREPTPAMMEAVAWRGEYAPSREDYTAMVDAALAGENPDR